MNGQSGSFSLMIKMSDSSHLRFSFDPIYMVRKTKYLVSVFDARTRIAAFNMEQKGLGWRIVTAPQVEATFLEMEAMLDGLIREHFENCFGSKTY